SVPLSSRGNSPVTLRCGASHSIGIGARLVRSVSVFTWSSISRFLRFKSLHRKDIGKAVAAGRQAKSLQCKNCGYKESHGKNIARDQNDPSGRREQAGETRRGKAGHPASPSI